MSNQVSSQVDNAVGNAADNAVSRAVEDRPGGLVKDDGKASASGPDSAIRIMIIDDSKTIRRSAESLLAREGWQVITAIDGFDALAKVVEHQPHIVFVDIMMPRLDGYQTCALIKNNAQFNKVPVIMLSSKDSIFDKAKGRVVGSEHYLTKPFTREDLLGTIKKHVPAVRDTAEMS